MNKRKIISSVVAASVLSIGMSMGICAKTNRHIKFNWKIRIFNNSQYWF